MSHEPVDMKLYLTAKDFLTKVNDEASSAKGPSKQTPGMYTYFSFPFAPENHFDEVYPKLVLGDRKIVEDGKSLLSLSVTHMVNCSMGPKFNQTNTSAEFYKEFNIAFHGIPAMDISTFKILPHLRPAADFIDDALNNGGKVYVHCQQGVSRSSTVVLAFLMLKRNLDLITALKQVREKRRIFPNDGFLKQLCKLQTEIQSEKNSNVQQHSSDTSAPDERS